MRKKVTNNINSTNNPDLSAFQNTIEKPNLHVLLYGPPKTGKTLLAASFPSRVGILDADDGMLSVMNQKELKVKAERKDIIWRTVRREQKYQGLTDTIRDFERLVRAQQMRTFVIDSLSTISDIIMDYVLLVSKRRSGQIATFDDWESLKSMLVITMLQIFDWPANIVLVAHEQQEKDEQIGRIHTVPMVTGNLKYRLPFHFDEVWHTCVEKNDKGKPEFWVHTQGDSRLIGCGSRLGLTETIENNFESIMEVYREKGGDLNFE